MDKAEISRRLKAARWLAGGVDDNGRVIPLSPEDLAQRAPLADNGITANAIREIEQLKKDARPMELREICRALDLDARFFDEYRPSYVVWTDAAIDQASTDELTRAAAEALGPRLLEAARALVQAQEREQREQGEPDRLPGSGEGAA